jgi:hypothetical protein
MTKEFIVRINYTDYAVDKGDAVALLDIASRMKVVKQNGYSGPYYVQPEQEPFMDSLQMQEVLIPEPEKEYPVPDAPSAAPDDDIAF